MEGDRMKKRRIFLLIPVLILLLLLHHHPVTVPDDVVSVEISSYAGTAVAFWNRYTAPEKIQAILDALSAMDPRGRATDLQITGGGDLIIVLQTADGEQAVYRVWDGRWDHYFYMGKNNDWYDISRRKCNAFYKLVDELEPDTVIQ